jgi:hypothetical protein
MGSKRLRRNTAQFNPKIETSIDFRGNPRPCSCRSWLSSSNFRMMVHVGDTLKRCASRTVLRARSVRTSGRYKDAPSAPSAFTASFEAKPDVAGMLQNDRMTRTGSSQSLVVSTMSARRDRSEHRTGRERVCCARANRASTNWQGGAGSSFAARPASSRRMHA